jgi:hypothetical protein
MGSLSMARLPSSTCWAGAVFSTDSGGDAMIECIVQKHDDERERRGDGGEG